MNLSLKKTFFYLVAASIPIFFFVILELVLRLFSYGQSTPLFIENPANTNYLLPRPDVMARYFPNPKLRPSVTLEANFFLKQKPDNGLRIFVQGGSTAAGFPYGMGASIAGTLEPRIKQSAIGRHVEVINTAMSAVNSYTLLDLSDEIIQQSPDAVLIYAGHNEYLGILGVGSSFQTADSSALTLMFLKLKEYRVFQLIQNMTGAFLGEAPSDVSSARTFMSQAAKVRSIGKDSELFYRGLDQFKRNMSLILDKYEDANIPVFLSTIASNQSAQKPFSSPAVPDEFSEKLNMIRRLPLEEKRQELEKLSLVYEKNKSADLHYALAKAFHQSAMFSQAKKHYLLAIDQDLLRFRAPGEINQIIESLAERNNVQLVDSFNALSRRSRDGLIGENVMLEHLHPNLNGYFVISNAFYNSIAKSKLANQWKDIPIQHAWHQRLVLPSEEYYAFATIQKLKTDYPFSSSKKPLVLPRPTDWQQSLGKQFFEGKINWLDLMEQSLGNYRNEKNSDKYIKTLQILADALPHNGLYNLQIAEIFERQKRFNEAAIYYRRALLAGAIDKKLEEKVNKLFAASLLEEI